MNNTKVEERMVPLGEYVQLDENKTLYDAIMELRALQHGEKKEALATTLLIVTSGGEIVTMLDMLDIFKMMEPMYKELEEIGLSDIEIQPRYVNLMLKSFNFGGKPLEDFCRKTTQILLKDIERELIPKDVIEAESTLDMAIHRMIVNEKNSLLVKKADAFVGVLRAADIFDTFCEAVEKHSGSQ